MAASKSQGTYFAWFLAGSVLLCGGLAWFAGAPGKIILLVGAGVLIVSAIGFVKIKHLEGETPLLPGPEVMKWVGAAVALLGWVVTIGGLRVATGSGGRIVFALIGIGLSLFGMLYVLPAAFNKTAFWKKPGRTYAQGVSPVAGSATVETGFGAAGAMGQMR
ncbi:MAG: hypothetical protein E6J62_09960 [Deltaproteobacteria bacterium]|nr:MAG: hypothetical protein E6J61_14355 [Deltaproteobacteria bacterium]TMB34941.1 MAG: hypothetical protein E6J62_09960 [Deltaproteobacteria bacterium]